MARIVRDPRVRLVLLLLIVLFAGALTWHLVGMPAHDDGHVDAAMIGVCLAILAAAVLLVPPRVAWSARAFVWVPIRTVPAVAVDPVPGRHPPDEGTVLLR